MRFHWCAIIGLSVGFSGAVHAQEYDVVVKTLRVDPVKGHTQDGSAVGWDIANSLPDPYVQVATAAGIKQSRTKSDTIRASYGETLGRVRKGDKLVFQVGDKDLAADDFVGFYETHVSARMLSEEYKSFKFDKVLELQIHFRKR